MIFHCGRYSLNADFSERILSQFYHKRVCTVCQKVPKDPTLCLLCGVRIIIIVLVITMIIKSMSKLIISNALKKLPSGSEKSSSPSSFMLVFISIFSPWIKTLPSFHIKLSFHRSLWIPLKNHNHENNNV